MPEVVDLEEGVSPREPQGSLLISSIIDKYSTEVELDERVKILKLLILTSILVTFLVLP